jgi:hypothetical protein
VDRCTLVVMEHGSAWPTHVEASGGTCVALCQEPHEDHGALLRRAYHRLRAIEGVGGTVVVAVLSCNDDASVPALEGRGPLARTLLATILRTREGRLELVARASISDRTRRSLWGLAGSLTEALAGTTASVSALFLDGEQRQVS